MPQSTIAVVAKYPPNRARFVIVIHHQLGFSIATNNTLSYCGFYVSQVFVRYYLSKLSAAICVSVLTPACSTPAIKPVLLFVMRGEKLQRTGFVLFTSSTV